MLLNFTTTQVVYRGKPTQDRRSREVSLQVAKGWCPVNTKIKNKALKLIDSQVSDRSEILTTLMQDPGLFTYVLRSICKILPEQDNIDALQTLLSLELAQLRKLIDSPEREQSRHRLSNVSARQYAETKHCVTSIAAAKLIAQQAKTDDFALAFKTYLSEISYLLVAWNYPVQFSLALGRQRKKSSNLKIELEKLLGIDITSIFTALLKEWRIKVADPRVSDQNEHLTSFLSDLAITWSRAQNEQLFPQYATALSAFSETASKILPENWQEKLLEHCTDALKDYKDFEPQHLRKNKIYDEFDSVAIYSPLANKLKTEQREQFRQVTARLHHGEVQSALFGIINNVAPALGFKDGCLFIKAAQQENLQPIIRFGNTPLSRYSSSDIVNELDQHVLASAIPFKTSGYGVSGDYVNYVASGLKNSELEAFLYLEYKLNDQDLDEQHTNLAYRCLRDLLEVVLLKLLSKSS